MSLARSSATSRRLLLLLVVFGLFLVFDIALFGWLIFRSLSEREVEKILLETQGHMQTLAEKIAGRAHEQGSDLYTAVATETETLTFIDSLLQEREFVTNVEILDKEGRLVWRLRTAVTEPNPEGDGTELEVLNDPEMEAINLGSGIERKVTDQRQVVEDIRDLEIPIRDLGSIQIGISPEELQGRAQVLRRELIRQVSVVGGLTLVLFLMGSLGMWFLLRRSRRLEEQATEAERMAYIGTLASGLAHEIRNPLNSLSLNMQLLQEEMGDCAATPSGPRLLSITHSEISRLERLVTDFLSYAKPRPLELESTTAPEVLETAEAMVTAEARNREARLETEDRTGGLRFQVDLGQIRQLLINLTHNALAATEEADREPVVRLIADRRGSHLVLRVEDNGVGIPAEDSERIFNLFYSTRRGGTGLGLAIVRRIVQNHGGRVEIDSTPGKGTAVSVYLPLRQEAEEPAPRPLESTA